MKKMEAPENEEGKARNSAGNGVCLNSKLGQPVVQENSWIIRGVFRLSSMYIEHS